MMKLCVLLSIFFISSVSRIHGQHNPTDSLLQTADHLKGEEKLERLFQILIWQTDHTPEKRAVLSALEQEAVRQESDVYIAKVLWLKMVQITSDRTQTISSESLLQMADESIEAYSKAKLYYGRTNVEKVLFDYYISHGEFELALYRTKSLLREVKNDLEKATAYHHLGLLYRSLNSKKKAVDILQKAILICEKHHSTDHRFRDIEISAYSVLSAIYHNLDKEYESALEAGNKAIGLLKEEAPDSPWNKECLFLLNVHKYQALFTLKQYDEAAKLLELLEQEKETSDLSELNVAALDAAYADYYMQSGAWEKALELTDKVLAFHTQERSITDFITFSRQKAEILDSLCRYKQASELKGDVIALSDSLTNSQTARKLRQLESILQIEQLEAEKKQNKLKLERTYILVTTFGLACLLLFLFVCTLKRTLRLLREKNRKLFEQYKLIPFDQVKGYNTELKADDPVVEKPSSRQVYNKTVEYLLSTQEYVKAELTRDDLARQVGTNRQYLIEAIQENAGMTFCEFINDLRLEHARKLLFQDNNMVVEKIGFFSGFNNKSTFYKHFNHKYGMTPAEFRRLANEEELIHEKKLVHEEELVHEEVLV